MTLLAKAEVAAAVPTAAPGEATFGAAFRKPFLERALSLAVKLLLLAIKDLNTQGRYAESAELGRAVKGVSNVLRGV
jgi:hypothetical protein